MAPKLQGLFLNTASAFADDQSNHLGDENEATGVAEINLDGDWDERSVPALGVHYISWQGSKRGEKSMACVVAHCTARPPNKTGETASSSSADLIDNVIVALAGEIGDMNADELRSMVVHSKTVDWTTAQMVMPMEAVVSDPPSPPWCCLTGVDGAKLIVAGDFMTHSSYIGCYASADAAADAVVANMDGRKIE
jgi:hypothetical protein